MPLARHVLGYWGVGHFDQMQALGDRVRQAIPQLGDRSMNSVPPMVYRESDQGDRAWLWGIAQPCDASTMHHRYDSGSSIPEHYLALSASGLITCQVADGTHIPDAWIAFGTRLRLGRDPFGRVPLYWLHDDFGTDAFQSKSCTTRKEDCQLIWFSTQLQRLLPLLRHSPSIDLEAFYGYTGCSYVPTPHTPVEGIQAIPAATELMWDGTGNRIESPQHTTYWQWQQSSDPLVDEGEAIAQLQSLLHASVEKQLARIPQGRVGVFLSGGLDSSIVAALLVKAGVDVHAYSLDLGNDSNSELPYAQQVADALGIPLTRVPVTPRRIKRAIAPTAKALDLPFGDGVTVPLYLLNQAAAGNVRVVFNGEHGDQLFAGWTNKPLIAAGIYRATHATPDEDLPQQYLKTFHRLYGYEAQAFAPEILPKIQAFKPGRWLGDSLSSDYCQTFLHKMRRATLMLKGAQNIQPRATALAWDHSLQVRSPFCNLALATWSFRLSSALQLRGNCEKYILKRAVESWLPPDIVWRNKRGMGVPLTLWCFNHLWHDLGRWLNPAALRTEGLWHPRLPMRVASYKLGGIQGRRVGEILWLMMMWQMWRQQMLGDSCNGKSLDHPFWIPHWLWDVIRKEVLE